MLASPSPRGRDGSAAPPASLGPRGWRAEGNRPRRAGLGGNDRGGAFETPPRCSENRAPLRVGVPGTARTRIGRSSSLYIASRMSVPASRAAVARTTKAASVARPARRRAHRAGSATGGSSYPGTSAARASSSRWRPTRAGSSIRSHAIEIASGTVLREPLGRRRAERVHDLGARDARVLERLAMPAHVGPPVQSGPAPRSHGRAPPGRPDTPATGTAPRAAREPVPASGASATAADRAARPSGARNRHRNARQDGRAGASARRSQACWGGESVRATFVGCR